LLIFVFLIDSILSSTDNLKLIYMKKFLFLFSGLLFISTLVYSQGSWTQKASLSGHARQISTGVVCNGKAYIWTGDAGVNGGNIKDFWEYDPTGNTWTQLADFPGTGEEWLPVMYIPIKFIWD
jgi:hypothetical protein